MNSKIDPPASPQKPPISYLTWPDPRTCLSALLERAPESHSQASTPVWGPVGHLEISSAASSRSFQTSYTYQTSRPVPSASALTVAEYHPSAKNGQGRNGKGKGTSAIVKEWDTLGIFDARISEIAENENDEFVFYLAQRRVVVPAAMFRPPEGLRRVLVRGMMGVVEMEVRFGRRKAEEAENGEDEAEGGEEWEEERWVLDEREGVEVQEGYRSEWMEGKSDGMRSGDETFGRWRKLC